MTQIVALPGPADHMKFCGQSSKEHPKQMHQLRVTANLIPDAAASSIPISLSAAGREADDMFALTPLICRIWRKTVTNMKVTRAKHALVKRLFQISPVLQVMLSLVLLMNFGQ